ncbi:MAG: thiamine pyrophosphate-binding protein [Pseudomonadota bacterium]|nr:thiamine pyrophosphate-binding protein [Pseudomonadota bacterium]
MTQNNRITVGGYLATRLREAGIREYFAIPGDYNLILLDELLKFPEMAQLYCCNELNAGYAADGHARARGLSAVFVTYSVGGLSIVNAAAGAYAEDLPVIFVSGAPNTNATAKNRLLHHTLGKVDYEYVRDMFARVTVDSVIVEHPDEAAQQIDHAIGQALFHKKPVYIEIACNIAGIEITAPVCPMVAPREETCESGLDRAVDHALELLDGAVKPVLVAGPKIRPWEAIGSFHRLVEASGYAMANLPNAKGYVDETHAQYMGTYWGSVSSPGCGEIVESSDAYVFAGPVFTDYTTVGYNLPLKERGLITVDPYSVKIAGAIYNQVRMADFLEAVAGRVKRNDTSLVAYNRIRGESPPPAQPADDAEITTRYLYSRIEGMLDDRTTLIAETGDSWFNGMRLKLPRGCRFEIQMQYGSIGWSVGATLGYQAAVGRDRRVIALIGDGSFQMTAQELSTIIRYRLNPIIFLFNNGGYTIEVEIHDGPYNTINNWDYAALAGVFNRDGESRCLARRVATAGKLNAVIPECLAFDGACLVEVMVDRDDCNKNLLKWGSYVATANGEPPLKF